MICPYRPISVAITSLVLLGCSKSPSSVQPEQTQPKQTQPAPTQPAPTQPAPSPEENDARIEKANQLLKEIGRETTEQLTPVFLYQSQTYREIVDDICGYKELIFSAAKSRSLDEREFFAAWQAMEHLPIEPYIQWMSIWVDNFKQGQCDYRRLRRILFPSINENSEYYYHFKDNALVSFYQMLIDDTVFKQALKTDNSMVRYGTTASESFSSQVDSFLTGREWTQIKEAIMACEIYPSHTPLDKKCPLTTVREKEKPPKWWKEMCDKAFGETSAPDTYWSGPGSDKPWWEQSDTAEK